MVKNCDRGHENAALGLRPRAAFSSPRSQFSLYGPTLSRQITCLFFFSCSKLVLQIKNVFFLQNSCHSMGLNAVYLRFVKKPWQRTSNSVDKLSQLQNTQLNLLTVTFLAILK